MGTQAQARSAEPSERARTRPDAASFLLGDDEEAADPSPLPSPAWFTSSHRSEPSSEAVSTAAAAAEASEDEDDEEEEGEGEGEGRAQQACTSRP